MWLGGSPANWMMYSPRSVSMRSMPAASSASLMPISSPTIDLPLVTCRASALRHRSTTMRQASCALSAQCTVPPLCRHPLFELLQVVVEMRRGRAP